MFGYLRAAPGELTEEELLRYRASYCGLCRSLRDRHGEAARLTLTYDMCFLVLLLSSLYEPEERRGEGRCLPHPFEERAWWRTEISDYAADLNLALACLKCEDDWRDDGNLAALSAARLLRGGFRSVEERWPRQVGAMRAALEELHRLEESRSEDADAAAACFGRMMAESFVMREDRWSEALRRFGFALGQALYVMDACADLDADALRGRYNPFRRHYGRKGNGERFRRLLRPILSDCMRAFDYLPLVQDAGVLKNILCFGLWAEFDRKYPEEEGRPDGTGSVPGPRRLAGRQRRGDQEGVSGPDKKIPPGPESGG